MNIIRNRVIPLFSKDKLPYIIRNSSNRMFVVFPPVEAQGIVL